MTKMIEDPKKEGIPVFLQIQNRSILSPRQQALVDEWLAKSRVKNGHDHLKDDNLTEKDRLAIEEIRSERKKKQDEGFKSRMAKAHHIASHEGRFIPGARWDMKLCAWIHTGLQKEGKMEEKTVAQLTAEYNELAKAKGLKPVIKFKTRGLALERIEKLKNGGEAAPREIPAATTSQEAPSTTKTHGTWTRDGILEAFKVRNFRRDLLVKLIASLGQMTSIEKLGGKSVKAHANGLKWRLTNGPDKKNPNLPFEIREEKKDGTTHLGLYAK